jgi:hypothetical protein
MVREGEQFVDEWSFIIKRRLDLGVEKADSASSIGFCAGVPLFISFNTEFMFLFFVLEWGMSCFMGVC